MTVCYEIPPISLYSSWTHTMLADILQTCVFVFACSLGLLVMEEILHQLMQKTSKCSWVSMSFLNASWWRICFTSSPILEGCRVGCSLARP